MIRLAVEAAAERKEDLKEEEDASDTELNKDIESQDEGKPHPLFSSTAWMVDAERRAAPARSPGHWLPRTVWHKIMQYCTIAEVALLPDDCVCVFVCVCVCVCVCVRCC
jgi:hypothetical protein